MLTLMIFVLYLNLEQHIVECTLLPTCTADNGLFLFLSENGSRSCIPCSVCPAGYQTQRKCTQTSDTVCEKCPSGSYRDSTRSKCKPCSKCKKGEYIRQICNTTTNGICKACPKGTFSMFSNTLRCKPCRYCKLHEETVNNCSAKRDQQCGECYRDYFRDGSTGSCLPCSYCDTTKPYLMVEECFRKVGHSKYICLPNGYTGNQTDATLQKSYDYPDAFINDSYSLTIIILSVCVTCAFILFWCFIVVQLPKVQKYIRWCRDKELYRTHNSKHKHEIDFCLKPSHVSVNNVSTKTVTYTRNTMCSVNEPTAHNGEFANDETKIDMPQDVEHAETEGSRLEIPRDTYAFEAIAKDSISTHVSIADSGIYVENDITLIDAIGEGKTVFQTENKTNKARSKKRKNKTDTMGTTGTLFSNPKYFPIHAMTTI